MQTRGPCAGAASWAHYVHPQPARRSLACPVCGNRLEICDDSDELDLHYKCTPCGYDSNPKHDNFLIMIRQLDEGLGV